METVFRIVYLILMQIAQITGLSYREINIIVYFFFIPMIYFVMIDKITKKHILRISLVIFSLLVVFIYDFHEFSDQLFVVAQEFLLSFELVGISYIASSVIFCVIIPVVIFFVLYYFAYIIKRKARY